MLATTTSDPITTLQSLAPLIMVLGVVMMGIMLTLSIRGKIARRNAARPDPLEMIEQMKQRPQARLDVEAAKSELHDTARRLAAQLDAKAERLEALIETARDCIDSLADTLSEPLPAIDETTESTGADSQQTMDSTDALFAETQAEPAHVAVASSRRGDSLSKSIYDLADAGKTPVQIARELGEQVGKVELILALRG